MPNLVYTVSAYVPFTKILSANINQDKTDIKNRINWSGTPGDAATGLDGTNIQSYTAVAETKATVTTQGITVTANTGWGANGNNITLTVTGGAIAGSEVVSIAGTAITIQVQSGTSTVTQCVTALSASGVAATLATFSGSSSSTVSTAGAVSLAGGVTGGGLTRSTKLALDSASYVVINNSSGQQSSEAALAAIRGGTGIQAVPSTQNAGDVFQVNSSKTAIVLGAPTAIAASLRVLQFRTYSFK